MSTWGLPKEWSNCYEILPQITREIYSKKLGNLLLYYGNHLPGELIIMILSDVAESLQYRHCNDMI